MKRLCTNPRLSYFLVVSAAFLFSLPVNSSLAFLSGANHSPGRPDLLNAANTKAGDFRSIGIAKSSGQEREFDYPLKEAPSKVGSMHLAQMLPFQAPSTPEIESQRRTVESERSQTPKPGQSSAGSKQGVAPAQESKVQKKFDRVPERTVEPTEADAPSKKSSRKKPKASPVAQSPSGTKTPDAQGLEPVNRVSLPTGASSYSGTSPLPPAMPYTPPSRPYRANQVSVPRPGDKLAEINRPSVGLTKPISPDTSLPSAAPMKPGESLDNFVLDSFKDRAPEGMPQGGQNPNQPVPPASLFGQLTQDIRQLGEGIKETFRSILPMR